ncbi:hypothetical protein J2Z21_002678 [Streptomyces griseochromogenes]|uniref:Uncharacterized protein n=1 Tax=Streptomyces griseochromogenes TaxID=68214 RepID=A0ABS4LR77_9ACTN|nr:hypothetical protein [Streptomyces griseochromogenes]
MFISPERLDAWYVESGIVDAVPLSQDSDVRQAIAVREAPHRLITARRLGGPCDDEALAPPSGPDA